MRRSRVVPYGAAAARPLRGLGATCPECHVAHGYECVPCPDGSPLPECDLCAGAIKQQEPSFFQKSPFLGPVIIGTVTTIIGALALSYVLRQR